MHELSIALGIVDLAEEKAREHGVNSINELVLEIGYLAGVEIDALNVALGSAIKGTMLEYADIVKIYTKGEGYCNDCDTFFKQDTRFSPCPNCGSYLVKITRGKELRVKSIVI